MKKPPSRIASNFGSSTKAQAHAHASARMLAQVSGMKVSALAEDSPFAHLRDTPGYQRDNWKAFIEYDVCHALPVAVLGPVPMGDVENYIGFFGETIAQSQQSLIFQQMNFRHRMEKYGSAQDSIIGTPVATTMPARPPEGWFSPMNPAGAKTAVIHVLAVVWKLAEGVDEILARHLDGTEPQSVSIEVITTMDNLGLWRPSTNQMCKMDAVPEAWMPALDFCGETALPQVGKLGDEQLIVVYGADGRPVEFRGVAVTPKPAEKFFGSTKAAARITAVNAEQKGRETYAICAEAMPDLIRGTPLRFSDGKRGTVETMRTTGRCAGVNATEKDPLVGIRLASGLIELPLSAVRRKMRHV